MKEKHNDNDYDIDENDDEHLLNAISDDANGGEA